jgi:hypothetical protein
MLDSTLTALGAVATFAKRPRHFARALAFCAVAPGEGWLWHCLNHLAWNKLGIEFYEKNYWNRISHRRCCFIVLGL